MTRIAGGGVSARNPFGPTWSTRAEQAKSVGDQVQLTLFGRNKPKKLDIEDMETDRLMAMMHAWRKKIVRIAGEDPDTYKLTLAASTIAMIDQDGLIYIGKAFLHAHKDAHPVLVGVLAHEIGHRPKRWKEYRNSQPLNKKEMEALCRTEETRADYFSGFALGELGLPCTPLIDFLKSVSTTPHPEYFPVHMRADVISEGHEHGKRKSLNRKKFFPELAKMMSADRDLGEG